MSLRTIIGAALSALAITTGAAQAATITAEKDACTPKDCYVVRVEGEIKLNDEKRFESVIKANDIKVAVVYLNSPGGNLLAGMLMGLSIHEHNFATMVYYDNRCVSVCASMWIAGSTKYVTPTSNIGFHQPYVVDRRGRKHVMPVGVAFMKKYYAEIGVPKPAADFFLASSPEDVYWMNGDLAAGFKIADVVALKAKEQPNQPGTSAPVLPPELIPPKEATVTVPKAFIESLMTKKPL
jgi:hypothetical protein